MRFLNLVLSFKFIETSTRINCQVERPDSRVKIAKLSITLFKQNYFDWSFNNKFTDLN